MAEASTPAPLAGGPAPRPYPTAFLCRVLHLKVGGDVNNSPLSRGALESRRADSRG